MRLVTGPAGSGKSALVVREVAAAVRSGRSRIRLLVPTATLAEHLAHRLTRDGVAIRSNLVQTLSGFVKSWVEDTPQVPDAAFPVLVEEAVRKIARPEFAAVAQLPGFCASLARAIAEFSSAGCDSARLARNLPDAPLARAFLAVYQEVDRALAARGLALRARRLALAAERIAADGPGVEEIWMDGFHALPDPELELIAALAQHAEMTVIASDGPAAAPMRARLLAGGFREEHPRGSTRTEPALQLVSAANIERETAEIARRILEQASAGRAFREMGIIVRSADTYVPILATALERFGIPARFYFDVRLDRHPIARFLTGVVDALLAGWDHGATLAALRLAPHLADSPALDYLDFAARAQFPNSGLGPLHELIGANGAGPRVETGEFLPGPRNGGIEHLLHALGALEELRSLELAPGDWAVQLRDLRRLVHPTPAAIAPAVHEIWRSQAAALDSFEEALAEAATALDSRHAIPLEPFWRAVKSVLRLKPMRPRDDRRNVVHVLSAHEARQWVLPVVFVCGMVERQFPQLHPQDPFFPDAARAELNSRGIRVRTAAEFEREERGLFDSAITRATMAAVLSYPEFDARGERNLPSLYFDGLDLIAQEAPAVIPPRRRQPLTPPPTGIHAPDLAPVLERRTARLSATSLEIYLRCPFEFFASRTLRLEKPPCRPEDRFDFIMQGNLVHEILAEWWKCPQPIEPLAERRFSEFLDEKLIPRGYHTERLRNAILDDLRTFAADDRWPRAAFTSRTEEPFTFPLDARTEISGKIDRLDTTGDGAAFVIDYKYSAAAGTRDRVDDPNLLQAPFYLIAAAECFGASPAGMFYVGLKGGVEYAGWSRDGRLESLPFPDGWLDSARERALEAIGEIRSGNMDRAPADAAKCRRCDFRDVCRLGAREARGLAESA